MNMTMSRQKKREYMKDKDKERREKWFANLSEGIRTGNLPWRKPWKSNGATGIPTNLKSKKAYRGGNAVSLMIHAMFNGWTDLRFATRKQLIEAGYSVAGLKNGTGFEVKYFKRGTYEKQNDDGEIEIKQSYLTRWYEVWCIEQCENYEPPTIDESIEPVPEHEMMKHFDSYVESQASLTLKRVGSEAFYRLSEDLIQLPRHEDFTVPVGEVMTAFHEAVHSTGHLNRCHRPLGNGFGSPAYAYEELIAELGSLLVVMTLGGEFRPDTVVEENANSVAYLKHWLDACKDQDSALDKAFHEAQSACDFIIKAIQGGEEE
jgi:antirestriction protein ArdC